MHRGRLSSSNSEFALALLWWQSPPWGLNHASMSSCVGRSATWPRRLGIPDLSLHCRGGSYRLGSLIAPRCCHVLVVLRFGYNCHAVTVPGLQSHPLMLVVLLLSNGRIATWYRLHTVATHGLLTRH